MKHDAGHPPRAEKRTTALTDEKESTERVAKILARRGLCSRREAERLIEEGQVRVDGVVVREQGSRATLDANIEIAHEATAELARKATVVLHKPVGIVSTQPEPGQVPAWKLLRADTVEGAIAAAPLERIVARPWALSVAGRLDRLSRGLLVLTEDGTVARRIIAGHQVRKSYRVRTAEAATDAQIRKLGGPLTLDEKRLLPMEVERLGENELRFVLAEGRKHQIRRVCRKFGLTVVDLFRDAIGPFHIGHLGEGHWRLARREELEQLLGRTKHGGHR